VRERKVPHAGDEAAAPRVSLRFLVWGARFLIVLLMRFNTAVGQIVFRDKVRTTSGRY
jgi:hypothetical protein